MENWNEAIFWVLEKVYQREPYGGLPLYERASFVIDGFIKALINDKYPKAFEFAIKALKADYKHSQPNRTNYYSVDRRACFLVHHGYAIETALEIVKTLNFHTKSVLIYTPLLSAGALRSKRH